MSNVLANLTGRIPKAVLYVRKYDDALASVLDPDKVTEEYADVLKKTTEALDDAENAMQGFASNLGRIAAMEGMTKAADFAGLTSLVVQYNPSSLYIDSSSGKTEIDDSNGGKVVNTQITQIELPSITNLSVQLIFDDMNQMDAFGLDAEMLSTGGALALGKSAVVNAKSDEGFTVRPQVEGLIACLLSPLTRNVIFAWGDMIFRGELVQVNANYTMFNKKGNPIRATVELAIQQLIDEDHKERNSYWTKAFDKAFAKDNSTGTLGKIAKLRNSSILNVSI